MQCGDFIITSDMSRLEDPSDRLYKSAKVKPPRFPDLTFEIDLWNQGLQLVAGIDEAGRGALAGPVTAATVILPFDEKLCTELNGVRDSKMMTPGSRERWAKRVREIAVDYGIGSATNQEIDSLGIIPATHIAVKRSLAQMKLTPEHLLTDYLLLKQLVIPQTPLIKGDARCLSIAAASILAKTSRDEYMRSMERDYPGYGFGQHKGYGTQAHRYALKKLGASPIHRLSFHFKEEA